MSRSAARTARPGLRRTRPVTGSPFAPDPRELFSWPDPRAARSFAAGAGEPGWLTGKAAAAYSCDAKITPMVCGHLDRNALARTITDLLAGDLANLVTSTDPVPAPVPAASATSTRPPAAWPSPAPCPAPACPRRPARRHRARPADRQRPGPARPHRSTRHYPAAPGTAALTPGGLARLQDTLLRYAVSLLSGPAGLAAYLRTQLTGGFFPSASLPLDLGAPTEQVPSHLRRALIKRDRHCSFPGCHRSARPLPRPPRDPPVTRAARPAWTTSRCSAPSIT